MKEKRDRVPYIVKSLDLPDCNKLQRPNSAFIQHTPHEAQYTS